MRFFDAISRTKRALPYPARMSFSRSIAWIGKKVITYYLKTPFFPIPAILAVLRRSDTRLKTRAGLAGAGFVSKIAPKSHRNRMKHPMCKRALECSSSGMGTFVSKFKGHLRKNTPYGLSCPEVEGIKPPAPPPVRPLNVYSL